MTNQNQNQDHPEKHMNTNSTFHDSLIFGQKPKMLC